MRGVLTAIVLFFFSVLSVGIASAAEVRIVDLRGLVRAVKVTPGAARVVITLEALNGVALKGECVATNVDGLAAEKRAQISPKAECVFSEVSAGSWQISVPQGFLWRVQLYDQ